jgi:hypothetical protein
MILSLVAVGETYREKLESVLHNFNTYKICLLTDLEREDVFYCEKYSDERFSYFDKFYFTLNLINKFKEDVFYVDVTKTNEIDLNFPKNQLFYYKSHWPYGDTFDSYKKYNYFKPLVKHWDGNNLNYDYLPAIRETELFFNKDIDSESIIEKLKEIQPIFRDMSIRESNYPGYDNGEGIALSYALKSLNII